MHFTEDKQRFEIIEDIPASPNGYGPTIPIRKVLYLQERKPRFCNDSKTGCGGALEYRDKTPLKIMQDDINGSAYDIVIYKKRFRCQKCGRTYVSPTPMEYSVHAKIVDAIEQLLKDPAATMKDLAKNGGFSQAAGTKNIKKVCDIMEGKLDGAGIDKRYNELRDMINSFHMESTLLFIPFEYRKEWRCLVGTCDYIENECFLLDILESDELKLIKNFTKGIANTDAFKIIQEVHCDAKTSVIQYIKKAYKKVKLYIARLCMLDALKRYRKKKKQQVTLSESSCQKIQSIIRRGNDRTWESKWINWKYDLGSDAPAFEEINMFIEKNKGLIDDSFSYEMQASFIELIKLIKNMQNNSFKWMRLRMLFANHAHYEKTHEPQMVDAIKQLHAPIPKMSIEDFGVRVPDLIEEIRVEQKIIEESELKDPIIV